MKRILLLTGLLALSLTNPTWAATSASSVTLQWTAPGDDGWLGKAATYDVRFSRYPITTSNFAFATKLNLAILPGLAGTTERLTVFGLTLGVEYYFAVRTMDDVGNWSQLSNIAHIAPGVTAAGDEVVTQPEFSAPRPNPARSSTSFAVNLPRAGALRVEAFDIAGRKVRTVAMGQYSAGSFDLHWNMRDDGGRPLEAGTYLVRCQMGEDVFLRRVTVVH